MARPADEPIAIEYHIVDPATCRAVQAKEKTEWLARHGGTED